LPTTSSIKKLKKCPIQKIKSSEEQESSEENAL